MSSCPSQGRPSALLCVAFVAPTAWSSRQHDRLSSACGGAAFEVEANIEWADHSWVGGGRGKVPFGDGSAVAGGVQTDAQARFSTSVGGATKQADALYATALGA